MAGMPGFGGFGGGFGGAETAAFTFSFGGEAGFSMKGFAPSIAHHYSYINNPILRQQAKMWYDMEASYNRSRAWFTQQYGGAMGEGPNYRASIVPNGIVERMEEQAFGMQQEHIREEFERELEEIAVAAYESGAAGGAARAEGSEFKEEVPTATPEDKQAIKKVGEALVGLEKALHLHEKEHGDETTFVKGVWEQELARLEASVEQVKHSARVSDLIKAHASLLMEDIHEGVRYIQRNPGDAAKRAANGFLGTAETLIPGLEAVNKVWMGMVNHVRGAMAKDGLKEEVLGGIHLGAQDAAIGMATAGVGKAFKGVAKIVKRGGALFEAYERRAMERVVEKTYISKFQSVSGKINEVPITWTAPVGTGQTYKVWQRTDIDWNMVRTKGDKRFIGKTNVEAARAGLAPQLGDGHLATLHHINQDGLGNLVEASRKYHGFGKDGHNSLHGVWGKNKGHPTNPIDRSKFEKDTEAYWKSRIEHLE